MRGHFIGRFIAEHGVPSKIFKYIPIDYLILIGDNTCDFVEGDQDTKHNSRS